MTDVQPAWEPDPDDLTFLRVYGPWEPLTPAEVHELMTGFPAPWWVVGGYAIEAFTGVRRSHEDVDVVIFDKDVPHLRRQLEPAYHLWSNYGGTFRFLDDDHPEPLHPRSQIWVREHAQAPWLVDVILNPDSDGRWQSKRDPEHIAELEEVTWVHHDGVRYLNPEVVLFHKALRTRPKDDVDLARTWPLMDAEQRSWLRSAVRRTYPGHPWNDRLAAD